MASNENLFPQTESFLRYPGLISTLANAQSGDLGKVIHDPVLHGRSAMLLADMPAGGAGGTGVPGSATPLG